MPSPIDASAQAAFDKARNRLLIRQPFFAMPSYNLTVLQDPTVPTACVDGVTLRYNPRWFGALPMEHAQGLLAHEVMHCTLMHMTRRGGRNPQLWNMAGDHVINLQLLDAGFKLPNGGLADKRFAGMTTNQVYAILLREVGEDGSKGYQDPMGAVTDAPVTKVPDPAGAEDDGKQETKVGSKGDDAGSPGSNDDDSDDDEDGSDDGSDGNDGDGDGDDESSGSGSGGLTASDLENTWTVAVAKASLAASKAGKGAAGADRAIKQETAPRESLEDVVRRYVTAKSESRWTTPNRRHIHSGVYLPGAFKSRIEHIVFAVDTSGSINEKLLSHFAGVVRSVLAGAGVWPERVTVLYCDDAIGRVDDYAADIELKAVGGGGTSFLPVFDWVRDQSASPDVLFYLTDLEECDTTPEHDPGYPVVWVAPMWVYRSAGPFGETVKVDVGKRRHL
jgi:predicted metal-dependent peptidase